MPKNLLKRENLSDRLADIVGRNIIRNELKPGQMIFETQIAKEWGVSRSPVRDALRTLEQKHLVERTNKGSYSVAEMSPEFIRNFYETVNILFQYAFAKSAEKAEQNSLRYLKDALSEIEKGMSIQDIDVYMQGMRLFAHTILKTSGNPLVEKMAMEMMPNAERIQWISISYLPDNFEKIVECVRRAYHCVVKKDPKGAAKAFADFSTIHIDVASQYLTASAGKTVP